MKLQTDPYGKAMKNYVNKRVKRVEFAIKPSSAPEEGLFSNRNIGQFVLIYIFLFYSVCLRNSSSPCRKDQFAVSYYREYPPSPIVQCSTTDFRFLLPVSSAFTTK